MEKTTEKLELITRYFADFTPEQLAQLSGLDAAYQEWNAKINVVSRKDIDQIYLHHVLHSLSIAAIAEWEPGTQVIDIGCGGGFPTVPLAIFFPEVKFFAVDSIAKKGGDLHQEIFESGTRPKMMPIYDIFKEDYFKEKYIIQVKK